MSDLEKNTTESSEKPVTNKKEAHTKMLRKQQWKPGQSGNPAGRPKGARGKLTLLREAVLKKAETSLLDNWEDIVKTTIELAKAGDPTCLNILWNRVIPAKRTIEDKSDTVDKLNISISIEGMEVKSVGGEKLDEPVEAEFTELKDD